MPDRRIRELLDRLYEAYTAYVVFPSRDAAAATALWTAATHAQPAWEHATRLAIKSPEKRCGKSRVLDVANETTHRPLITVNATIAAITRSISESNPPTLIVDEADTIWSKDAKQANNEEMRGLLNAGHQRNRPVIRWNVTTRSLETLPSFAMAALASIRDLPDTIEDRAVVVNMRRRAPGETVKPWRSRRDGPPLRKLRDELHKGIHRHLDLLRESTPDMPVEDRDADNWEPLVAIADLAGGPWPKRVRRACLLLTANGDDPDTGSLSVRLLSDLRRIFDGQDKLQTDTILQRLMLLDEAPWADLYGGKGLSDRGLANLLRPYEVRSRDVRVKVNGESRMRKGYYADDLADPWSRYVGSDDDRPWDE